MRGLVLDNETARLKTFTRALIGHSVTCVMTAEQAIKKLSEEKWDIIFLDHDLDPNGAVFQPSGPGTGWEVAKWLSDNPDRKPGIIVLHSLYDQGRKNMMGLLPEAMDVPGAWLMLIELKERGLVFNPVPIIGEKGCRPST